ncbi:MAG: tetratricopeptide repeat protein [Proteobacteria bacterium]|nr:tetratricopeptide repeat protein [Pseudomonadota bacterium]
MQLITIALFFLIVASSAAADDFADVSVAGIKLYEKGRYEDALLKLEEAKRLAPADGRIDYNLGNINYQLGRFGEARKNWQDAIIKVDRSELRQKAYYNIANAFYREERYQEAVRYYQKALQINRKDYETGFNLKLALHQFELQKKMRKEEKSKKTRQDRKEQEAGNDILEQRKKTGKRNSNKSKERVTQERAPNSKGFQEKKEKDSYSEKLSLNAAKRYLKTLKEGKCKYRSMFAEGSKNKSHSAQNDW